MERRRRRPSKTLEKLVLGMCDLPAYMLKKAIAFDTEVWAVTFTDAEKKLMSVRCRLYELEQRVVLREVRENGVRALAAVEASRRAPPAHVIRSKGPGMRLELLMLAR